MSEHDDQSGEASVDAAPGPEAGRGEDGEGAGDQEEHFERARGETTGLPGPASEAVAFPRQTPLFHAHHANRYARQELIQQYEEAFSCRLVVMIDDIFPESVTLLEELIIDADPRQDLHLLLDSPGGDGETAVRLVRSAQARCRQLTVIVPNQAKSAGTILLIGAHHILMGQRATSAQ